LVPRRPPFVIRVCHVEMADVGVGALEHTRLPS
jgi:hypothetical protein